MNLDLARSLSRPALLVVLHLEQRGQAPIGVIADATGLSPRSIQRALAELREAGVKASSLSHDHHGLEHREERNGAKPDAPEDPIVSELAAHGIWPGAAVNLIKRHGAERVRVQLAYHQIRLDGGFTFKAAPAAHLYRAIVDDYAPWAPPAPGNRKLEHDPAAARSRPTAPPAADATPYPEPATAEDRSRHFAEIRKMLGRG